MVIVCKDIMLAAPAMAIVKLAQYVVNEINYCFGVASMSVNKMTKENRLLQACISKQSTGSACHSIESSNKGIAIYKSKAPPTKYHS